MTRTWQRMAGTALGVALLAGAGVATVAAREQGPGGPGRGGMMGRRGPGGPGGAGGPLALPLRELALTDTQREQVRTAVEAHKGEFDAIRTRMQTARTALNAAVTAAGFDEAAVRQKSVVHSEVWALLTPEQQQKASALKAQRAERRAQGRERFEQRRQERQRRQQQG
jgi:Spy/CpxP family protein refolding chaperone